MLRLLNKSINQIKAVIAVAGLSLISAQVVAQEAPPGFAGGGGGFKTRCPYVKTEQVDPIVSPGQMGMHMHTFFGSGVLTNVATPTSIRTGPTSCVEPADKSGYWVPTFYGIADKHEAVVQDVVVYYLARGKKNVKTIPPGLRMITPASPRSVFYSCVGDNLIRNSFEFPACPKNRSSIFYQFGDCWNGRDLNSVDHRSYMTHSKNGVCPASHPVEIPQLQVVVRYKEQLNSKTHQASSGALNTLHADFMNGWDMPRLNQVIRDCIGKKFCTLDANASPD